MRCFVLVALALAATAPVIGQVPSPIVRTTPQSVRTLAPVFPYDLLLQGREGAAEVQFMVEYSGKAILPAIVGATDPAFAQALLAEIEANEFLPLRVNGQPRLTPAQIKFSFTTKLDAVAKQVLGELRKPLPALPYADQLDKRPVAVRQDQPTFPYSLQSDGVSGHAEVEIVIDRNGRVLFPRVIRATNADIGYAAAALVSRWKYQPPMKDGQAVDARHTVTVNYDQAKMATSW
jgi:TonB family protein